MGAECSHNRLEPQEEFPMDFTETLWKFTSATVECLDCGKTFPAVKYTGRITGYKGKWHIKDPDHCEHEVYWVDEDNIKIEQEQTLIGSVARLFMVPSMDGIQYHSFLKTEGRCGYCQTPMSFRSGYKNVWKNDKQTD